MSLFSWLGGVVFWGGVVFGGGGVCCHWVLTQHILPRVRLYLCYHLMGWVFFTRMSSTILFISPESVGLKTEAVQGKTGGGRPGAGPFAKACRKNFFSCFRTQYSAIKEQNGAKKISRKSRSKSSKRKPSTVEPPPPPPPPALPQAGSVAKAPGHWVESGKQA